MVIIVIAMLCILKCLAWTNFVHRCSKRHHKKRCKKLKCQGAAALQVGIADAEQGRTDAEQARLIAEQSRDAHAATVETVARKHAQLTAQHLALKENLDEHRVMHAEMKRKHEDQETRRTERLDLRDAIVEAARAVAHAPATVAAGVQHVVAQVHAPTEVKVQIEDEDETADAAAAEDETSEASSTTSEAEQGHVTFYAQNENQAGEAARFQRHDPVDGRLARAYGVSAETLV